MLGCARRQGGVVSANYREGEPVGGEEVRGCEQLPACELDWPLDQDGVGDRVDGQGRQRVGRDTRGDQFQAGLVATRLQLESAAQVQAVYGGEKTSEGGIAEHDETVTGTGAEVVSASDIEAAGEGRDSSKLNAGVICARQNSSE